MNPTAEDLRRDPDPMSAATRASRAAEYWYSMESWREAVSYDPSLHIASARRTWSA